MKKQFLDKGFKLVFGSTVGAALIAASAFQAAAQTVPTLDTPSLILIDADTDQPVSTINTSGGQRIVDLSTTSARNFTVLARFNAFPENVGSVLFDFNNGSRYKIENFAPFALAGDISGDLLPLSPSINVGTYRVSATAYTGGGATGASGARPGDLIFSLFDGSSKLSIDSGNVGSSVNDFIGDAFFGEPEAGNEGDALTLSSRFPVSTDGVENAAPQRVYFTQRTFSNFVYRIRPFAFGAASPGPLRPNTAYKLRLHFAELTDDGAGKRQFNVSITDQLGARQLLENFDIFSEAGGARKAIVKEFDVVS